MRSIIHMRKYHNVVLWKYLIIFQQDIIFFLVTFSDDKKLSLGVNIIGWNSLKKKKKKTLKECNGNK